jgi:hypothetical protein
MENIPLWSVQLPRGYIHQHTLWTRATFEARPDSKLWRNNDAMIMLMPRTNERNLHKDLLKIYPDRYGGLPAPSIRLTRLALIHLNALDPDLLGREQRFESITRYMGGLASSTIGPVQAAEAKLFAEHFEKQLDYYKNNTLTAEEERELGL